MSRRIVDWVKRGPSLHHQEIANQFEIVRVCSDDLMGECFVWIGVGCNNLADNCFGGSGGQQSRRIDPLLKNTADRLIQSVPGK